MFEVHYVYDRRVAVDIGGHVFAVDKYRILARWLREELRVEADRWHGWEPVTDADLERVHTPGYLDDLAHARRTRATLSSELPVTAEVIGGFVETAGGSIAAVRWALAEGVGFHLGGGFHHAFPDHAEGFCYLHDMAIAVQRLRAERGLGRVLFVDVDVHQGNGTAAIYRRDAATFTYSIHQENNYPIKERSDLDRGLPDGIEDDEYVALLRTDLDFVDARFRPDLVCYVAGVDPYVEDHLGGLSLSAEGLARRDALVLGRYVRCGIPVAVFPAGGYAPSPEQTAQLHLATARAAEQACREQSIT